MLNASNVAVSSNISILCVMCVRVSTADLQVARKQCCCLESRVNHALSVVCVPESQQKLLQTPTCATRARGMANPTCATGVESARHAHTRVCNRR